MTLQIQDKSLNHDESNGDNNNTAESDYCHGSVVVAFRGHDVHVINIVPVLVAVVLPPLIREKLIIDFQG